MKRLVLPCLLALAGCTGGDGRDFEDGPLPDAGLVWTSSLDGTIGTGRSFNRMLSAGTNVITLTVTDSDGGTGVRSISLTITP